VVRAHQRRQDAEQRRLAGAVVAEQRAHRLRAQRHRDAGQRALVAVPLDDLLDVHAIEAWHYPPQTRSSSAITCSRRFWSLPERSSSTSSSSSAWRGELAVTAGFDRPISANASPVPRIKITRTPT